MMSVKSLKNSLEQNNTPLDKYKIYTLQPDDDEKRLDQVLRRLLPKQSLGNLQRALRKGDIRLENKKVSWNIRVKSGMKISVYKALVPSTQLITKSAPPVSPSLKGEKVLFEDENLLFLNKPEGLPIHGPNSMISRMSAYLEGISKNSLSFRAGPLHRLDQGTGGILTISKSLIGARIFSKAIQERRLVKEYLAVVHGNPGIGEINVPLIRDKTKRITLTGGDKPAVTRIHWAQSGGDISLIKLELVTGFTHQIRAHLSQIGHPLVGDQKYGSKTRGKFFLFHFHLGGMGTFCKKSDVFSFPPLNALDRFQKDADRLQEGLREIKSTFGKSE